MLQQLLLRASAGKHLFGHELRHGYDAVDPIEKAPVSRTLCDRILMLGDIVSMDGSNDRQTEFVA
jgi:hypothetical protein